MSARLELFTLEEVAATFRVSPRTMREHVKAHPFYRVLGGRKLFTRSDIKALYEALVV
jgi:Helix-turn-helix domain